MFWAHGTTVPMPRLPGLAGVNPMFQKLGISHPGFLTVVRLYEPLGRAPLRGMIVHLTGIRGLTTDAHAIRLWRSRGWRVLVVTPPANIIRHRDPLLGEVVIDTPDDAPESRAIEWIGHRIAAEVDHRLAEWAYVVEGVLAQLDADEPGGTDRTVIVGMSLGAIALPATVARMPERFEAAVLIAGGANLLQILESSPLAFGGVRIRHQGGKLTTQQWQRVMRAYLDAVRLDPYAAAGYLSSIPVLQLQASLDGIVPADAGELLYTRLGMPERLVYPVGHIALAWLLPTQAGRIERWIRDAMRDHNL